MDENMMMLREMLGQMGSSAPDTSRSPSGTERVREFVQSELETLMQRQRTLQESLHQKSRELQVQRETVLAVSGAIQGLQQVLQYLDQDASAPKTGGS